MGRVLGEEELKEVKVCPDEYPSLVVQ